MHVLYKPVSGHCQLRCEYCFYGRHMPTTPRMDVARRALEMMAHWESVPFALQGGEPLLAGFEFVRDAVKYGRELAGDRLAPTVQTNGILIDEEWAAMFAAEKFLVGVSCDGPKDLHDERRVPPSYDRMRAGIDQLNRAEAEWNVLCVVHKHNADQPLAVYRHMRDTLGAKYIQFIPEYSELLPSQWGHFLTRVFSEWWERDREKLGVLNFEAPLQIILGGGAAICTYEKVCGRALLLEHDGCVYSCDHFANRENYLGSIMEHGFETLAAQPKQLVFGLHKKALPTKCRTCRVLNLCRGQCPRGWTDKGEVKLCRGYEMIYGAILNAAQHQAV